MLTVFIFFHTLFFFFFRLCIYIIHTYILCFFVQRTRSHAVRRRRGIVSLISRGHVDPFRCLRVRLPPPRRKTNLRDEKKNKNKKIRSHFDGAVVFGGEKNTKSLVDGKRMSKNVRGIRSGNSINRERSLLPILNNTMTHTRKHINYRRRRRL